MRASVSGELTSRTQVVDHLLDLRLAARPNPTVVAVVDELLAGLPGQTTVSNVWWLDGLAHLERVWRQVPATTGSSPAPSRGQGGIPGQPTTPPPLPRRRRPQ